MKVTVLAVAFFLRSMGFFEPARDFLKTRMRLFWIGVFSCLILTALSPPSLVFSESNHVFPSIDEQDFIDYVKRDTKVTDGQIHIFSSLSVLNSKKENIIFNITEKPYLDMIALTEIKSYPVMKEDIRSEYFDFTLWGQMENFFNKDFEVIQQETRIFAILKELEAVNQRYLQMSKKRPDLFNPNHTVTIDQNNYFTYSYDSREKSGSRGRGVRETKARRDFREKKQASRMAQASSASRRLKEHVLPQQKISREQVNSESAKTFTLNTRSIILSAGAKKESTWIDGLFKSIAKLYAYFLNNKIISIIVLTLLLLFLKMLAKVFFLVFLRV